jgi:hypothetical protein
VANTAILAGVDVVLLKQAQAEMELICGRFVVKIKNRIERTQELFGFAMTGKTPLHVERGLLPEHVLFVDVAVTALAAHPFFDVRAVVEIDVVREVVDLGPLDRFLLPPAGSDGLEELALFPDLRVAVHAGLGRRHSRIGRVLDRRMAVAAIDPQLPGVVPVTELNGLLASHALTGGPRGAIQRRRKEENYPYESDSSENQDARQDILAAMKNLHSL